MTGLLTIPLLAKAAPILVPVIATLGKRFLGEDDSLFKELAGLLIDKTEEFTSARLEEALKQKPDVVLALHDQVFMQYTGWVLGEVIRQFANKPQCEVHRTELSKLADQAPENWTTFVLRGSPGLTPVHQDAFLRQMAASLARDGSLPTLNNVTFITFFNWNVRLPLEVQQKLDQWLKENLDNALHVLLLEESPEALQAYKQIVLTGIKGIRKELYDIQEMLRQNGELLTGLIDSPGFDLDHYAQKLALHCERIPFSSRVENAGSQEITLSSVFVEPTLRSHPELDPEMLAASRDIANAVRDGTVDKLTPEQQLIARRLEEKQSQSLPQEAFKTLYGATTNGHIILAHAGVGKSSLVRRMALRWAVQTLHPSPDASPELLPILIELKTFASAYGRDSSLSLLEFLHSCEESLDRLDRTWSLHYLRTGAAILILDGLDEVSQRDTRKAIANGASRLRRLGVRVIVTSRREGFITDHWLQQVAPWTGWVLDEFSHEQRAQFIGLILPKLYASEGEMKRKCTELERRFARQPAINQLSTNPLLLTLITVLQRTGRLGDNRLSLYKEAAELLLDQWEAEHFGADHIPFEADIPCDADTRREIVRRLALKLASNEEGRRQCFSENLFGIEVLKDAIREVVDPSGTNPGHANMAANHLPLYLNERHSVICYSGQHAETGEKLFSFIHRTFLEYFTALAWVEEIDNESATDTSHCRNFLLGEDGEGVSNWENERLVNIIPFYFGLLKDNYIKHRLPLLWQIMSSQDKDDYRRHDAILFAAQVWSEITGRDRKHSEFSAQLKNQLFNTAKIQGSLADRDPFYPYSKACSDAIHHLVLLFDGTPGLVDTLLTAARDSASGNTFRREILSHLPALTSLGHSHAPIFHEIAQQHDVANDIRNAALKTLSNYYGAHEVNKSLDFIVYFKHIDTLDLSDCYNITKLPDLHHMTGLKNLYLNSCVGLYDSDALDRVTKMDRLTTLSLASWHNLKKLPDMRHMIGLRRLDLSSCIALVNSESLNGITGLTHLDTLVLNYCENIRSLPDMSHMTQLKSIYLYRCTGLHDATSIETLKHIPNLKLISIVGCSNLKTLPDLRKVKSLKTVYTNGGIAGVSIEELHHRFLPSSCVIS